MRIPKQVAFITIASNLTLLYYTSWYTYKVDALTSYPERVEREALIQSSDSKFKPAVFDFWLPFSVNLIELFKPRLVWHHVQLDKHCCRSDHSRSDAILYAVEGKDSNFFLLTKFIRENNKQRRKGKNNKWKMEKKEQLMEFIICFARTRKMSSIIFVKWAQFSIQSYWD